MAGLLLLTLLARLVAHDIPDEIVVQTFVKPAGERLHVLVRLPLALLLNMNLPKRGPGYLDFAHLAPALKASADATARELDLFEEGRRLAPLVAQGRVSLPSDRSFERYTTALAHLQSPPLAADTELFWNQGFFDARLEYPIRSDRASFSLEVRVAPGLAERTRTFVELLPPDAPARAYRLAGGSGLVHLDPRWHQAAWSFVRAGFLHILEGADHLLFLFCLVIPFRRLRTLVLVITAFTVAHSFTLLASAYGLAPSGARFPPLVEAAIAASIVYMALENVVAANLHRRWFIAFAFGLVHGFGFSFALRDTMQFAGSHLVLSLVAFNVGVELGQILVLLLLVPALAVLLTRVVAERVGILVLSVIVAHTGWHWMIARGETLLRADWPAPGPAAGLDVARWILMVSLGAAAVWFLLRYRRGGAQGLPDAVTGGRGAQGDLV